MPPRAATAEQSVWRNTLDHFDAIKIGLTATQAAHTKAYFTDVVFRYEYGRAVREGFLVDYGVVKLKSDVRMQGVFLKQGERVLMIDPETGSERLDEVEDEREFESTALERTVTSPDSNRKILEEIKKHADEHEAKYGRFPKTLIFAANDLPHPLTAGSRCHRRRPTALPQNSVTHPASYPLPHKAGGEGFGAKLSPTVCPVC